MTKRDLAQYYYLKKDIAHEEQRLAMLELSAAPLDEVEQTRKVIELKKAEAELQYQRTTREIYGIDDIFMRQIFLMRHVDLLSWATIAARIGGDNTPDGVRMAHDRYIKAQNSGTDRTV